MSKTLDRYLKEFEVQDAMQATTPNAWQLVGALIEQRGWNYSEFYDHCRLDEGLYYNAKRGDKATPKLEILMAICVGMDLSMVATTKLLAVAGINLSEAIPLHRAYKYIIEHLAGEPISVRNEFLKHWKFKELGSGTYLCKTES